MQDGADAPGFWDEVVTLVEHEAFRNILIVCTKAVMRLLPAISTRAADALAFQGLTLIVHLRNAYAISQGDTIVVYAAARGAGILLTRIVVAFGARVIAIVSSA
jgi:NADPH:quinone reductase-like Zn-dependent oxidoreductase